MDPQRVLESLARDKGASLTSLKEVNASLPPSKKLACCGGIVTRVVTESAADSTVLLRDGSDSCFCALHSDITSRYPDVLTTGALLLFTDVTVLILSTGIPPLLIACLQNLSGLLLPDEASAAAAVSVMDTGDSVALAATAATADSPFLQSNIGTSDTIDEQALRPQGVGLDMVGSASRSAPLLGEVLSDEYASVAMGGDMQKASHANCLRDTNPSGAGAAGASVPSQNRVCVEDTVGSPAEDNHHNHHLASNGAYGGEDDDDDDAECLELVDDL